MKLLFVSNNPVPYHTPILNSLSEFVNLHVLYMSNDHPMSSFRDLWGEEPKFGYSFYWSRPLRFNRFDFRVQLSIGVSRVINRLSPDVILFSSWGPLVIEPLLWKFARRRKSVMWAESTRFSGLLRDPISNSLRKVAVNLTDTFVANGSQARIYLEDLGIDPGRVVTSCLPSTVPTNCSPTYRQGTSCSRRGTRFLFVGRLIERKRPVELVEAFRTVLAIVPDAHLTIVGDGPLFPDVSLAAANLSGNVSLIGRKEGEELNAVFRSCDVLVVPSVREVWGLVVNEALSQGLFVIATDQVGSAYDLISDANGIMVPADDVGLLADAMIRAAQDERMEQASLSISALENCTPENFAKSIYQAAHLATGQHHDD